MANTIILEYGSRATRQPAIVKFDQESISIGRGYTNDLIMPNRYIGEQQFKISHTIAGLELEILDFTNTVKVNGKKIALNKVLIDAGDRIVIGQMEFRVHDSEKPLPPTHSLGWTTRLESHVLPLLAATMLFLVGAECLFSEWIYQLAEVKWQPIINESLLVMGFCIVWAGGFSLLGRLLKHETHYSVQLLFTALALLVISVGENLISYLSYYSGSDGVYFYWNWIAEPIILSILVFVHFKYSTMLARPFLWAAILTYGLCGVLYSLQNSNESDFNYRLEYEPFIKAPFLTPFSVIQPNEFIDGHQELIEIINEEINTAKTENGQ